MAENIQHVCINEKNFTNQKDDFFETIFTVSNGHFGTRGSREENFIHSDRFSADEGTFVNGFFEKEPIQYGEIAYGYAKNHQTICRVTNGKQQTLVIDGEKLGEDKDSISQEERKLNLQMGTFERSFVWRTTSGKEIEVRSKRMSSLIHPSLLAITTEMKPLNFSGEFSFYSVFEQEESNAIDEAIVDPRKANRNHSINVTIHENEQFPMIQLTTQKSNRSLLSGKRSFSKQVTKQSIEVDQENEKIIEQLSFDAKEGETVRIETYVYYSEVFKNNQIDTDKEREDFQKLTEVSHQEYFKKQQERLADFWENTGVEIDGDEELSQGMQFNLFHLFQAAGRNGKTNIAAKGLTGDGYEGHFFWDTEMYMLPFFIFTQPALAKKLLHFRYSVLENARSRAREMGIDNGALFAWRTIDGEECSAYYPAGTAQVHINADIAYAFQMYFEVTEDKDFMKQYGLKVLIETARFWIEFGYFDSKTNQFVINGVTGPDEYTALINNNYYTNRMAKNNLDYATKMVEELFADDEDLKEEFIQKLNFDESECTLWKKASESMRLPYDDVKQLTLQDDAALKRERWPLEETPKEEFPLLLHHHPMMIYRKQVNKQADTILCEMLFPSDFTEEQMKRDYNFYEEITTHDSSLSRSVFGIVASRLKDTEKAYDYFMSTALMDLNNVQGNTGDGIHAANLGGTWLSLVYGFGGMVFENGNVSFHPKLPKKWNKLTFTIQVKSTKIKVSIFQEHVIYQKLEGQDLSFYHEAEKVTLKDKEIKKEIEVG